MMKILSWTAIFLLSISYWFQIYKIHQHKEVRDLSMIYHVMLALGFGILTYIGEPIILEMTSTDVIHSFYIPSFRVKRDTVPGMISKVSFTPTEEGNFTVFCTEFCGTSHSRMRSNIRVVKKDRYEKWINRQIKEANISDPVELGYRIYNNNCATCHSLDGSKIVGPSFQGLWGSNRAFEAGESLVADADYIRESIINPQAKIVKGYTEAKMNSFAGQFDEKQLGYLVEFLKTQK